MCCTPDAGIKEAYGKLMCFTDDDAIWNSYFLKYLLVPFNDDKMGGTGSNQIMRPVRMDVPPTTFERIGDMRLSSRMLEAAASTFYDGSVSCLSGRTALYHKRIMEPLDKFEKEFCNEYWFKCVQLPHGCLTPVCVALLLRLPSLQRSCTTRQARARHHLRVSVDTELSVNDAGITFQFVHRLAMTGRKIGVFALWTASIRFFALTSSPLRAETPHAHGH
jgi:hypothetical protein